jgi:hypothetical protein
VRVAKGWEAVVKELESCSQRLRAGRCPAPGLVTDVVSRRTYCRMHAPFYRAKRSSDQKVKRAFREMLRTSFGIG